MPRRNDIKKVMIIGSGPIIIGQACELPILSIQYHCEAALGPQDNVYLFEKFVEMVKR